MSKTVLITGASTGFGRYTAEILAHSGHAVFATMRDPAVKNREAAASLQAAGIEVVELDVTDTSSVSGAVVTVLSKASGIDVLINNAGVASAGVSEAFTDDQVSALFDVNVIGLHRVTRAVLPTLRQQGDGLIINIGSILGRVTFPFFGIYGASKFAVEALTDSLRYEVSQLGVDVALVQPSAYPTNMYGSASAPADGTRVTEYGEAAEIPGAMLKQFAALFESPQAPNPHDVAQALVNLIALPKGQRPALTVVGTSFGADRINEAAAPIQANAVTALGLHHLQAVVTA